MPTVVVCCKPRVVVRKRQKYAEVDVDLWPCDFNLNDAGKAACLAVMKPYRERTTAKDCTTSAGTSFLWASSVLKDEAETLADELLALVTAPERRAPLDKPRS